MFKHINIAPANLESLPQLVKLFEAYRMFYKKEPNPKASLKFLSERIKNKESVIFIALNAEGNLVGFVQLYPLFSSTQLKRFWLLNDLFVDPNFRGKGFADALITSAKKHCRATNASGMMLETAKTNTVGNKLYHRTGFVLDQAHNFFYWDV